ncbi:type I restriction endonuclease [Aromatoleum evansii]|uniref:type I restriction endonuclease n=1 Tax=Aromatoleum evansii TaxID=59406 RepID=UPI001B7D265D|nr:type I restriction endonuclease [Aromatoleum evansii]
MSTTSENKMNVASSTTLHQLISEASERSRNEADTRHKIIDYILHDYLHWPRNRVFHEENVHDGYADFILKKSNGDALLVIEAKKEGVFFELPIAYRAAETSCFVGLKKLTSDKNIAAAVTQVRNYCFELGCEYACITNGHEWIFFKTFEKGKKWETLQAFVIRRLDFFADEATKAENYFSFIAVTENSSLVELLTSAPPKDRSIFSPKEKIVAYSHAISANRLANTLRPMVKRYFGVIGDDDKDFMSKCYVSQREYHTTFDGMRTLIHDSLSPYFEEYGVQQLEDTGKGGRLGGRITKNIKNKRPGEVLVLFGGKGSGKSTFIKRILHHNAPRWLKDHSISAVVDLLKTPESQDVIRREIWDSLVAKLDPELILESDRDQLTSTLFQDRFATARKQDLAGLSAASEAYNIKLNQLVRDWKDDKVYCAKRLVSYWADRGKGAIVVVDNTDQYCAEIQDFCFTSAQEISKQLDCVVLVSMREERFYVSKIHGVLDAFQKSGFHISSPKPSEVFKKRLDYTVRLLENFRTRDRLLPDIEDGIAVDCIKYLNILIRDFSKDGSPLNSFLTACAHGDIRLSLDLFSSFLLSGYTNVDEMIGSGAWTFKIHQVIKPVMVPTRYFYDEKLSDIPNIYQLRSARHGSHFTGLRVLRKLAKGVDVSSPSYFSVPELRNYFAETFNMVEDFERNLDVLLKHGFVEANNRLDAYSAAVDSIKITNYGFYMLNELSYYFTYLDLVCTDCGIFDQQTCNYLAEAAKQEYRFFTRGERMERIRVRLERVDKFIAYLNQEEYAERELYGLGMPEDEMFSHKAKVTFSTEKETVRRSAAKQPHSRQ